MVEKIAFTDPSTWKRGWIVEDAESHILICVDCDGTVVGFCDTRIPPEVVKRWIIKVGEFKQVNITNQDRYIKAWNEKMVDDDNDKYRRLSSTEEH